MLSLGIYKPGQGYWVRTMTACMIAIATFASAAWAYREMSALAQKLPITSWTATLSSLNGTPAESERVTLLGRAPSPGAAPVNVGTAVVAGFSPASNQVRLKDFQGAAPGSDPTIASAIAPVAGSSGFSAAITSQPRGERAIQPELLQGIAAVTVLVLGAILAYWFTAAKPSSVDFLIATDMEMKKVNWSSRRDIWNSTLVVIGASVLIAGTLFVIDLAFHALFKAMGVLTA